MGRRMWRASLRCAQATRHHVQHSQLELHSRSRQPVAGGGRRPAPLPERTSAAGRSFSPRLLSARPEAGRPVPPTVVDTSPLEVSPPVAPALLQSLEDQKLSGLHGPGFEPGQVTSRFPHPSVRNVDAQQKKGAISEGQALLSAEGK